MLDYWVMHINFAFWRNETNYNEK